MNQEIIQVHDLSFKKYLSKEIIHERVCALAENINAHYQGIDELVVLVILKGAFVFAADLIRELKVPCRIEMMRASSYGAGIVSSGKVQLQLEDLHLKGKHVLIVEDIIDTGHTIHALKEFIQKQESASVKIAVLISKPEEHSMDLKDSYVGFEVPTLFIVGYGLDYNQYGRELPDIWQLHKP